MEQWPFVIAAYGVTAAGTAYVLVSNIIAMRRAEAAADRLSQRPDSSGEQ